MPVIPVQLSVQGGAAKLALLIAFMEAIEELHDRDLRVTHIAGTSAGAIAGTLFAAHVPMATVRNRLSQAPLKKIMPQKGWTAMAWALASGDPVWNESGFEKLLNSLLDESHLRRADPPRQLHTFDDIHMHRQIKVKVVATDLKNGLPVVRQEGDAIISSLLDSAALPFFFRARNSRNAGVVDGGLCENLPSDFLANSDEDGPIIAVSFLRKEGANPTGLLEYSLAVVGAGIDYSSDKAKRRMEERARISGIGHDVFSIDSKIDSLDFERAIRQGLGELYEPVKNSAKAWLQAFVQRTQREIQERAEKKKREDGYVRTEQRKTDFYKAEMPKSLAKMYKTQHEIHPLRWSHARLEVVVSPKPGGPDSVNYRCEFHSLDQVVWCQRVPMLVANSTEVQLPWQFFDPDRQPLSPYYMIMDEDGNPETLEWLICFDSPLPARKGPYRFTLSQSVPGFADKLRINHVDDFWVSFRRSYGPADQVEVIVRVPNELGIFTVEPKAGAETFQVIPDYELENRDGFRSFGYRGLKVDPAGWGIWLRR